MAGNECAAVYVPAATKKPFATPRRRRPTCVNIARRREREFDLWYGDEAGFTTIPSVPYAWQKVGERLELASAHGPRQNVFGLLSLQHQFHSFAFAQGRRQRDDYRLPRRLLWASGGVRRSSFWIMPRCIRVRLWPSAALPGKRKASIFSRSHPIVLN